MLLGGKTKWIDMMSMKPSSKIVKFLAPESGGSGPRVESNWSNSKNVLKLWKSSSLPYIFLKNPKCKVMVLIKPSTLIVKCLTSETTQGQI